MVGQLLSGMTAGLQTVPLLLPTPRCTDKRVVGASVHAVLGSSLPQNIFGSCCSYLPMWVSSLNNKADVRRCRPWQNAAHKLSSSKLYAWGQSSLRGRCLWLLQLLCRKEIVSTFPEQGIWLCSQFPVTKIWTLLLATNFSLSRSHIVKLVFKL